MRDIGEKNEHRMMPWLHQAPENIQRLDEIKSESASHGTAETPSQKHNESSIIPSCLASCTIHGNESAS